MITKEEFERMYAKNSRMTVERLHELGLEAHPCDCEYERCQGWQMLHKMAKVFSPPHTVEALRDMGQKLTKGTKYPYRYWKPAENGFIRLTKFRSMDTKGEICRWHPKEINRQNIDGKIIEVVVW